MTKYAFCLACALLMAGTLDLFSAPIITDTSFTATYDGSTQRYIIFLPDSFQPAGTHDLLIILHGHGSDRAQCLNANVASLRNEFRASQTVAMERGMIYVSPDYRCCTSWMGPAAEADVVQLIGILKARYGIARTFISGASMGGASCLEFTLLHPDLVQGVASMNGMVNFVEYLNFQDAISASFGGTKTQIPQVYHDRSAEFFPERFTMPVSFTADSVDGSVPPQSVWRLVDTLQARGKTDLLLISRSIGHSTSYADAKALIDFVVDQATPTLIPDRPGPRPSSGLRVWRGPSGRVCCALSASSVGTGARLAICNVRGALVRTLTIEPGSCTVVWDGNNAHGRPMLNGQYIFQLVTAYGYSTIKGCLVR
jgi:predicted esterase